MRACKFASLMAILLTSALWTAQASAQQIHRDGFAGRETGFLRGTDNVRGEEKLHELTDRLSHNGPTSEHIRVVAPVALAEPATLNYFYPTPQAPLGDELAASVWVKSSKAGITLSARLVLPRERNPKRPDELMTTTITGSRLPYANSWARLDLNRPMLLAKKQQQALRIKLGRAVDFEDAYIDRLILNLYTGEGQCDVFIDDLEIGPVVKMKPASTASVPTRPEGILSGSPGDSGSDFPAPRHTSPARRGIPVRLSGNKLKVDGKPYFVRAVRHSGTPLKVLRDAGFNTVWFDVDAEPEKIEAAIHHGFWIVPSLPLLDPDARTVSDGDAEGSPGRGFTSARTPEGLTAAVSRFLSGDGVLFWDLGGGRSREQLDQVTLTARAIQAADPGRPIGADIWDGFDGYSLSVDLVGTHRWPLMSSLGLREYRDWLGQRRRLAVSGSPYFWTWIQTHVPEHQAKLLYGNDLHDGGVGPVGPHPEQIRLLTYLALCSGAQGVGYWSDRFLADSHHGRDRLLALALVNQELSMLEDVLLSLNEKPKWIGTSDPNVEAAVLRSELGTLVLPVWIGAGGQYVPGQGAVARLGMVIPQVPDGTHPWRISPSEVTSMQANVKRVPGGVQLIIPDFDLTAAVFFTHDLSPASQVVKWQDNVRTGGKLAAQYSMDLAAEELRKIKYVHEQLRLVAPPLTGADGLLEDAERRLQESQIAALNRNYSDAARLANQSRRPLRLLMRGHWDQATAGLDLPSASPYATSFFTLAKHWELARQVQSSRTAATVLDGSFENIPGSAVRAVSAEEGEGREITDHSDRLKAAGWDVMFGSLDNMAGAVEVVSVAKEDLVTPRVPVKKASRFVEPYAPTSTNRLADNEDIRPRPELGRSALRLSVGRKKKFLSNGKPYPAVQALERTYLAVRSPELSLPPGTLVRVSGWMKITAPIQASADGVMVFDNVGGEALGVRRSSPTAAAARGSAIPAWEQFRLYRRVPSSGKLNVTMMLTGVGEVFFDDVKVEPLVSR